MAPREPSRKPKPRGNAEVTMSSGSHARRFRPGSPDASPGFRCPVVLSEGKGDVSGSVFPAGHPGRPQHCRQKWLKAMQVVT